MSDSEFQLGEALVPLLSGVVERDGSPRAWSIIMSRTAAVMDYLAALDLELVIKDADGFAFARQRAVDPDAPPSKIPRLVARRPLSARVSLLLVLLRRRMAEHDASDGAPRLLISRDEIIDLMRIYLPETGDETRLHRSVDTAINTAVKLGYLGKLKASPDNLEVRRVIKSMIDADWLNDYHATLVSHLNEQ